MIFFEKPHFSPFSSKKYNLPKTKIGSIRPFVKPQLSLNTITYSGPAVAAIMWVSSLCPLALQARDTILHANTPCKENPAPKVSNSASPSQAVTNANLYKSGADFSVYATQLREKALLKVAPQVFVPSTSARGTYKMPWKDNIVTTVFWVGEASSARNPVPNRSSSWDGNWAGNYGGYDTPDRHSRRNYLPVSFTPKQNPFYFALPYNDVTRGKTKPEARLVIPWFKQYFTQAGHSVCKDHWIAIKYKNKIAYAQWEDAGPFRTDHYQYVFGNERPRPNLNGGAGLDVSPAVRDYLGMDATRDVCSWKFVEPSEVPSGPWRLYGDNNIFVLNRQHSNTVRVLNQSFDSGTNTSAMR